MPYLQGYTVIVASYEAVFYNCILHAHQVYSVTVENPVDDVYVVNSDIGRIVY